MMKALAESPGGQIRTRPGGYREMPGAEREKLAGRALLSLPLVVAIGAVSGVAEAGQSFNETTTSELLRFAADCSTFTIAGSDLATQCEAFPLPGGPGQSGGSSGSSVGSPTAPTGVVERLRKFRQAEAGSTGGSKGASADTALSLGQGFGIFLAPGYERLNHSNNRNEDGYEADIGRLAVGGDYQFSQLFLAGIALNYDLEDADYDDGHGYRRNTYGLTVYASVLPVDGMFIDLAAGYGWRSTNDDRATRLFAEDGTQYFRGKIRSDYDGDLYNAGVLIGYDFPIQNFTLGPRVGFNAAYQTKDDYSENGNTGLELEYDSDSELSLQSSLGAVATVAVSTSFGVLVPQVEAAWIHEFADDQHSIQARFRDSTPAAGKFKFDTESPDRNFAVVGAGVSAVLPNGLQPFVSYRTLVGNDRYDSHAVNVGLRFEL